VIKNRVGRLERAFNVVADDPLEGVTVKRMLPLFHGSRSIDEAPPRIIRALTYMAVVDLARVLRRAQWESASDADRAEALEQRRAWGLPPEGLPTAADLVELGRKDGLSAAICKRLSRELPGLLAAPDPDAGEAVPGHELPPP
jgi:hypothetical protein